MTKPFTQIPNDLFEKLFGGHMPVRWTMILLAVIRQSIGFQRDNIGSVNLRGLATMIGGEHYYSGRFLKELRAMERAGILRLRIPRPRRAGTIAYFERDPRNWRPFDARTGVATGVEATPELASDCTKSGVQTTPYKRKKESGSLRDARQARAPLAEQRARTIGSCSHDLPSPGCIMCQLAREHDDRDHISEPDRDCERCYSFGFVQ